VLDIMLTDERFVDFAMHRVRMLQHFGVIPFLVFDGDYLPSKAATEANRRKRREEHKKLGLDLLQAGKTSQAYLELQKAIDVTPEMARQLIDELKKTGVQYIVAPYEADAQMVYLERKGLISGILSEDSDLLVFGAKCLLTKLDQYGNCIEVNKSDFCACREINLTGWSDTEFRCMAILSGCDYLNSIGNMGLKTAHQMVRKHKTIEKVLRMLQFDGKYHVPQGYLEAFYQAELTFLHQRVYCPISNRLVFHTEPNQPIDEQKMLFIGAYVEPEVARRVAMGELNPMTKQPMFPGPARASNASRASWAIAKPQPRRAATSDDLKKEVSIEQFFKPQKRIPLGELDPNSFTLSPIQQNALLRNTGSWAAEPVPRQYLRRSNTDILPQPQSATPSRGGWSLPWTTTLSETRPQKRTRLCADDVILGLPEVVGRSNSERSPFFDSTELDPSPSIGRSSKAKRSKKDDITIFSDDSIEEALLSLPEFDSWHEPKSKNKEPVNIFNDEVFQQDYAQPLNRMDAVKNESQDSTNTEISQISVPGLTQSSSILSSADETPTPVDSFVDPAFSGLKEKFALTPTQNSSLQPLQELATPLSSKHSRIPRAVKAPTTTISSGNPVQPRVLTPLQSLGAKALNRSSKFWPTPPFTPKSGSSAALPRFNRAPSLKPVSSKGVPFPEAIRPPNLKASAQLDPVEVPLPVPDQDELVALSMGVADEVNGETFAAITHEGKGSEDLIICDSEEEVDEGVDEEVLSPINTASIAAKFDLDQFAFKG
jgi:exonuclease-1